MRNFFRELGALEGYQFLVCRKLCVLWICFIGLAAFTVISTRSNHLAWDGEIFWLFFQRFSMKKETSLLDR